MVYDSKAIWIVGPVRSGTNWVCSLLSPLVESCYCDNEFFRPLKKRHLLSKHKSFSFKINEDHVNIDELVNMYPNSKVILVNRDGRDVANSIAYPNKKSIPFREFNIQRYLTKDKTLLSIGAEIWVRYLKNHDNIIKKNPEITYYLDYNKLVSDFDFEYKKLCDFIGLPINENELVNIKKPLKTPNQNSWSNWSEEDKNYFKNAEIREEGIPYTAGELLVKYGYENDNNW